MSPVTGLARLRGRIILLSFHIKNIIPVERDENQETQPEQWNIKSNRSQS